MFDTMAFRIDRMQAAADDPNAAAVDLAEFLVSAGVPFRQAHMIVGGLVRAALDGPTSLADLVAANEALGPEAARLLAPGAAVRNRTTAGSAGPGPVTEQLRRFHERLAIDVDRVT
jgi:argininosuccinate lyase